MSGGGAAPSAQYGFLACNGSGASDVCTAIRRASRAVTHLYELVLSPTGLKATQFVILQAIAEHGGSTQSRLAEEYGMSPESLSRRLATLRRAGLVRLQAYPGPGAGHVYQLTTTGARKLASAIPYWSRAQQRLRSVLGTGPWQIAVAVADEVAKAAMTAETAKLVNGARREGKPAHGYEHSGMRQGSREPDGMLGEAAKCAG